MRPIYKLHVTGFVRPSTEYELTRGFICLIRKRKVLSSFSRFNRVTMCLKPVSKGCTGNFDNFLGDYIPTAPGNPRHWHEQKSFWLDTTNQLTFFKHIPNTFAMINQSICYISSSVAHEFIVQIKHCAVFQCVLTLTQTKFRIWKEHSEWKQIYGVVLMYDLV